MTRQSNDQECGADDRGEFTLGGDDRMMEAEKW